jgi:hypothetical protein
MIVMFLIIIVTRYDEPSGGEEDADRVDEKVSQVGMPSSSHVSNNPQRQVEIFDALSSQDLAKLLVNLRDDNECIFGTR